MLAICLREVKDVKVALCGAEIKASMKTFQKVNIMNTDIPVRGPARKLSPVSTDVLFFPQESLRENSH